jgi:hypothetical protein
MEATEIRRNYKNRNTPLIPSPRAAWDKLIEEFGEDARQLEWPSARECAEEAVKAMMDEANVLLSNPAVKRAWENFMLICELTKENKDA